MKKRDLLKFFDDDLLDKLFGFCYARTNDSYEAEELCSDIVYALVKAANSDGEIESIYPFIWRVAHNVYADFSNNRRKRTETIYEGGSEEILLQIAEEDYSDDTTELLRSVYRRMAFLTKAYREVMIMFYIDGLSTAQIANAQGTSEGAVRQRLDVSSAKGDLLAEMQLYNKYREEHPYDTPAGEFATEPYDDYERLRDRLIECIPDFRLRMELDPRTDRLVFSADVKSVFDIAWYTLARMLSEEPPLDEKGKPQ